jgi:hypothetical protein
MIMGIWLQQTDTRHLKRDHQFSALTWLLRKVQSETHPHTHRTIPISQGLKVFMSTARSDNAPPALDDIGKTSEWAMSSTCTQKNCWHVSASSTCQQQPQKKKQHTTAHTSKVSWLTEEGDNRRSGELIRTRESWGRSG